MNKDLVLPEGGGSWPVDRYLPGAPQRTAAQHSYAPALDLATLIRILREWRWVILGAVALGLALGVVATLLATPLYRAWVTLEVNPPNVEIMEDEDQAPAVNPWDFVATQAGLLRSRALAERVAQELNLANNPAFVDQSVDPAARVRIAAGKVAGGLRVVPPEEGQLIQFSYVSDSPQFAATIANALAEEFINSNLQRRYEASAYARTFLERQIAKTRADLERSERSLVQYAQSQGIIDTSTGEEGQRGGDASSLQGQSLVSLNQALAEATARRVAAEGAYRQARATGATSEVTQSTQALRQSRATLEAEYQEKRALMKPDHPEMMSLRSRIEELDRQIARESGNVASGRANSLLAEYRAALSAERALQARVAQLKGSVLDLRGRSIRYTILQREVDTNRALYDALLQRYKEIGVAGGIGAAPVSIVDRADVPGSPFTPNLMLNLLLGMGGGLLAGLIGAIGLEFLNDTVRTREDVREKLGIACLGAIPKRSSKDPLVEDLRDPSSEISEAYSNVVASLRFSTERGVPQTLLLTSARAAEGKSSSALALAQNFARRGTSVLLIDSDLRKPAFRAPSSKQGLTKLLTTEDKVGEHVTPTEFKNLWLLPAGPLPPNPADLLSTSRFQAIIREANAQFDIVIVDAPPVLGMADAVLLAAICKDVVFIIESGKTRTAAALEALNRLYAANAHVIGATLTKAAEEVSSYGYGYSAYRYGAIDTKRQQIAVIPHQQDA